MANPLLESINPQALWAHFGDLIRIARPSKSEEAVLEHIQSWADKNNFSHRCDKAGNLVVAVPANITPDSGSVVVLQSHVDIVVANADQRPPGVDAAAGAIPILRANCDETECTESDSGDWIVAPFTTLGADDGIGVAAAMAIAEDQTVEHGKLHLLFTVDEEEGLTGANQLDASLLEEATYLINLDSEDDDIFTIGCAGGLDTEIAWHREWEDPPPESSVFSIAITGLKGGHSGLEINRGRANAIGILARLLLMIGEQAPFRIAAITGGDRRNAIPRSASSRILLERGNAHRLEECCAAMRQLLKTQFADRDDGIRIEHFEEEHAAWPPAFSTGDSREFASLLVALPAGVVQMTPEIANLVETSNNLALVSTTGNTIQIVCSSRSSSAWALEELHDKIQSISSLAGATVRRTNSYSGWQPSFNSHLLSVCVQAFRDVFAGSEPKVESIHAGLECGAILAKKPELEAISIGPTIRGNHAPGERVCISSVAKFYRLLAKSLELLR